MKISVKSPTRVDIAGGTNDLWPMYAILGGACTVNYAISIYTYVELEERSDTRIVVDLSDINFKCEYEGLVNILNDQNPQVQLIRVFCEYFKPAKGFNIKTKSESPVGGGLGGSSSLCISMIQAFNKWLQTKLTLEQTIVLAHNLEAQLLGLPTGTQDYYPPALGGLCIIDYNQEGPSVQKVSLPDGYLEARSFLVYTGKPHHSGLNNWEVLKNFIEKNPNTISCLKAVKRKAQKAKELCLAGRWDGLSEVFEDSYKIRTKLSPVFTSPEIERLKDVATKEGALGVKILGAGGGGSVLIWTTPEAKGKVLTACQSAGFQILNAAPVELGSQVEVI